MTPIQTAYKGYNFRSRLEARWAVFFDHLGVKWEYEPEGFEIDGQRYLPDFRTISPQRLVSWYEIKPLVGADDSKFNAFQKQLWDTTNDGAALLQGDPFHALTNGMCVCPRCGGISKDRYDILGSNDIGLLCQQCDFSTPIGGGHPFEHGLLTQCTTHKGWVVWSHRDHSLVLAKISRASEAARSARFEHGQSGATL